jgi:hypothetical protein
MTTSLTVNYDARAVGVPYLRVRDLRIIHPPLGSTAEAPRAIIGQRWAVKLADNTVAELGPGPDIEVEMDLASPALMPLVDNDSGLPLSAEVRAQIAGAITAGVVTEGMVMLMVLASVRAKQAPVPEV